MKAPELLNNGIDIIKGVFEFEVGIRWRKLKLQYQPVKFVHKDYDFQLLSQSFFDESLNIECHSFYAVNDENNTIA